MKWTGIREAEWKLVYIADCGDYGTHDGFRVMACVSNYEGLRLEQTDDCQALNPKP